MFTAQNNSRQNVLTAEDHPIHDWYRFVLSYPPHLVRHYLERFDVQPSDTVLDPFCGTGTTLVECKKNGIASVGIEANPLAHFASAVKLDWSVNPDRLLDHAHEIAAQARHSLKAQGLDDDVRLNDETLKGLAEQQQLLGFPEKTEKILLSQSISPVPLHKALVLRGILEAAQDAECYRHERLALAAAAVQDFSNLHFGPEVGVGQIKTDASVVGAWLTRVETMANDLRRFNDRDGTSATVLHADARHLPEMVPPQSIQAVITSPPYPNEKDYTRITRLETVLLGFADDRAGLQALKRGLLRSNTRNVYKGDTDDLWVRDYPRIQALADQIEARRIELGKTSGFERLYSRVTRLYFGGMAKQLADLRAALRPGAQLAYVVGDQASFFRILIRTGELLGEIATTLGYQVIDLDLFRTRIATATREQLREEVLVLRWPG